MEIIWELNPYNLVNTACVLAIPQVEDDELLDPELAGGVIGYLVALEYEVGARGAPEALTIPRRLVEGMSRASPPPLRWPVQLGRHQRWWRLLSVAAPNALAEMLLQPSPPYLTEVDGNVPDASDAQHNSYNHNHTSNKHTPWAFAMLQMKGLELPDAVRKATVSNIMWQLNPYYLANTACAFATLQVKDYVFLESSDSFFPIFPDSE